MDAPALSEDGAGAKITISDGTVTATLYTERGSILTILCFLKSAPYVNSDFTCGICRVEINTYLGGKAGGTVRVSVSRGEVRKNAPTMLSVGSLLKLEGCAGLTINGGSITAIRRFACSIAEVVWKTIVINPVMRNRDAMTIIRCGRVALYARWRRMGYFAINPPLLAEENTVASIRPDGKSTELPLR